MKTRLLACMVVVAVAGCKERAPVVPPTPASVTVQVPVVRDVTTHREFAGRLDAVDTVEIRTRLKGVLQAVEFQPGQRVSAGDVLFRLEAAPFEAAVAAAEARVAQQRAALDLAEVTLSRTKTAQERGAATELEVAEALAKRDSNSAEVRAAEAALRSTEIDLDYTIIASPISGRVSRELVDVGNLVGADGATLLTTVVRDDPIYVYLEVDERSVLEHLKARPRPDNPQQMPTNLQLELADETVYAHLGRFDFAETRVDVGTGTLEVRAVFPNPDGTLVPGMFARILAPDEAGPRVLIPEVALLRDIGGVFVLVVDASNIVQRRPIALGQSAGPERIVLSGLEATDRVIVNGVQRAIPGRPVAPTQAPAPSGDQQQAGD